MEVIDIPIDPIDMSDKEYVFSPLSIKQICDAYVGKFEEAMGSVAMKKQ